MTANAFAQPMHYHHSGPPCADGSCLPNTYNFGYYQTRWRRWPTSPPPMRVPDRGAGSSQSLPPPEIPQPRYEGDPSPPVRPPRELPGAADPLSAPPALTPPLLPPPQSFDALSTPLSPLVQRVRTWAARTATAAEQYVPPPDEFPSAPASHVKETTPAATTSTLRSRADADDADPKVRLILPSPAVFPQRPHKMVTQDAASMNQSSVVFRVHPRFQPANASADLTP